MRHASSPCVRNETCSLAGLVSPPSARWACRHIDRPHGGHRRYNVPDIARPGSSSTMRFHSITASVTCPRATRGSATRASRVSVSSRRFFLRAWNTSDSGNERSHGSPSRKKRALSSTRRIRSGAPVSAVVACCACRSTPPVGRKHRPEQHQRRTSSMSKRVSPLTWTFMLPNQPLPAGPVGFARSYPCFATNKG